VNLDSPKIRRSFAGLSPPRGSRAPALPARCENSNWLAGPRYARSSILDRLACIGTHWAARHRSRCQGGLCSLHRQGRQGTNCSRWQKGARRRRKVSPRRPAEAARQSRRQSGVVRESPRRAIEPRRRVEDTLGLRTASGHAYGSYAAHCCGTVLPRTCSSAERTSGPFSSCSGMQIFRPLRFTLTSSRSGLKRIYKAHHPRA